MQAEQSSCSWIVSEGTGSQAGAGLESLSKLDGSARSLIREALSPRLCSAVLVYPFARAVFVVLPLWGIMAQKRAGAVCLSISGVVANKRMMFRWGNKVYSFKALARYSAFSMAFKCNRRVIYIHVLVSQHSLWLS